MKNISLSLLLLMICLSVLLTTTRPANLIKTLTVLHPLTPSAALRADLSLRVTNVSPFFSVYVAALLTYWF